MAKFGRINRLAPEDGSILRGLLVFIYYFKYSGWKVTKFQLDLVLFVGVRRFWDLTCDFWAENAKNKLQRC